MTFVDSHCHIDGPEYDDDRDEVIARAVDAGVTTMLNVGTGDPHSGAFERAVQLAEKHESIYAAVGVHPHDAKLFDELLQLGRGFVGRAGAILNVVIKNLAQSRADRGELGQGAHG